MSTEGTLKKALNHLDHIIKNPDEPMEISGPSPEIQFIKNIIKAETECPHCKFIEETFCRNHPIDSNRNYWQMTEVYVYLHDGKDYCNYNKENKG